MPSATQPAPVLDPLADIAAVLNGHDRMRTQEVLTALAALNPRAYGKWTFTDLKNALPESAQTYKTKGVQQLSAHRVAEALADRDNTDDDSTGLDDLDGEEIETD